MQRLVPRIATGLALAGFALLSGGCSHGSDNPDAKVAENAVGIGENRETKTGEVTRDVTVERDVKVIDNVTGKTIRETHETTPVKITEETREKKDVDVHVGETRSSTTAPAATPK